MAGNRNFRRCFMDTGKELNYRLYVQRMNGFTRLPFASESSQLVRFHLEMGKLEVSSQDLDFATAAKEHLTCEYTNKPMSIGFKGSSLLEILNNIDSEEVVLQLADPSRAGIIVPATQPENEDVLMLIMPMLLND